MNARYIPAACQVGVDILLNGHAHLYQRGYLADDRGNRMLTVTTGGGGGELDTIRVADWSHIDVAIIKHHVVVVEELQDGLRLQAVDLEGELLDEMICCKQPLHPPSLAE